MGLARLPRVIRVPIRVAIDAIAGFSGHHGFVIAAAMAFHVALSLAPLMLLTLWLASLIDPTLRPEILERSEVLLGERGAQTIAGILEGTDASPRLRTLVGWVLLGSLLFTTSGAFIHLQWALNTIWGVRLRPWRNMLAYARKRLISVAMIGLFGLLLLGSVFVDAILTFLASEVGSTLRVNVTSWNIIEPIVSLSIIFVLFAAFFRVLPDVRLTWDQVSLGALITTLLFAAGKLVIARYLGTRTLDSVYGAAGSFIAILLWVYYSSIIFFFGVELSRASATVAGRVPEVERFAERVQIVRVESVPAAESGRRARRAGDQEPAAPASPTAESRVPGSVAQGVSPAAGAESHDMVSGDSSEMGSPAREPPSPGEDSR